MSEQAKDTHVSLREMLFIPGMKIEFVLTRSWRSNVMTACSKVVMRVARALRLPWLAVFGLYLSCRAWFYFKNAAVYLGKEPAPAEDTKRWKHEIRELVDASTMREFSLTTANAFRGQAERIELQYPGIAEMSSMNEYAGAQLAQETDQ